MRYLSPTLRVISLAVFIILCVTHLPAQSGKWYKGNLHTHSYWSDGDDFPEVIIDWYKKNGYHFLALSEHNILAEGEKWITLRKKRNATAALQRYLELFGADHVSMKLASEDTLVQLATFDQYAPMFEEAGKFLLIPSEEITDKYQDKPVHLNATNIQELIEPQHGKTMVEVIQNNVNAVVAQREKTGVPMFVHINHPNFGWAMTSEDLIALNGERFFEVYNGHPAVNNYGDDSRSGTEEMWDDILTAYLDLDKPCMYGIAVDDSHNYHSMGLQFSNSGRGWVMVKAASLSRSALVEAMEAGQFYASTGVSFKKIKQKKGKVSVKIQAEPGITYTVEFIGSTESESGKVLYKTDGTTAAYTLGPKDRYVRVKVTSSKPQKNPYKTGDTEAAWTQPFFPGGHLNL